jgi:uncharacterized cupin superfamily protein
MIRNSSVRDLEHHELWSQRTGEKFSLSAVLTEALGFKDVFVHHEIIPPGRRSSGTHFHSRREEMVFVLEGNVKAWCEGTEVLLEPGDFVGFPPGKGNAHYLINDGDHPARVLAIASNPDDDQVEYVC